MDSRGVIRYTGQPLPPSPRVGVIANDAIGNFVMATPLLQLLRAERAPGRLVFFGGTRTRELQEASDLFDESVCLHGASAADVRAMLARSGEFDLLINLESTPYSKTIVGLLAGDRAFVAGPCIGPGGRGELPFGGDARGDLWRDKAWIAADVTERYPFLRSGFIAEIFCRLCYLDGDLPPYRVPAAAPAQPVPEVLIATAASLPDKLWPLERWHAALEALGARGRTVGLLGAPPTQQAQYWKGTSSEDEIVRDGLVTDLRGAFTLPEVVGALGSARAVLALDNGILHLAAATTTPTVGLFRHGIHRLWTPPAPNIVALTAGEGGAVADIDVSDVLGALLPALGDA
jgi:ADP-heptose:LPS heptosyltransferase